MKLLLYGINYAPELTGIGKYTGEMASYYASKGHEVEVITAPPYYPNWVVKEGYPNWWKTQQIEGVTVHRCPLYVPKNQSGPKRILHEISFVLSSFVYWLPRYFRKYDAIICISPPFHLGFIALPHKWIHGTRIVNHIQDLQVDAARATKLINNETLLGILEAAEKWILSKVTRVSTISSGMAGKLQKKLSSKGSIIFFPNWVDKTIVHPIRKSESLRAKWGISDEEKIVLYSGNLGVKQGLEIIPFVAKRLEGEKNLTFIIVGNGGEKQALIQQTKDLALTNVQFLPLQPLEDLARMLAAADIHLVLQKKDAADLVMPSKFTNILAAGGHALVTAEPGTTLFEVVHEHQLGTICPAENKAALEATLRAILNGERKEDAKGAVEYANKYLDKTSILNKFLTDIDQLSK